MLKKIFAASSLTLVFLVAGATQLYADGSRFDIAQIQDFAEGERKGRSLLVRDYGGVMMSLRTSDIERRSTVTIWWVVFNYPENCATTPCSANDLANPATGFDVLGAADGGVIRSKRPSYIGVLRANDTSGSINPLLGAEPIGLLDPFEAEIHLVVRSHGPMIRGQVREQITTFEGGCTQFLDPPAVPQAPGECADIQFSIHQP